MKKLLVLEDEPSIMKLLRCTLKQHYNVIEAVTAEEALLLFIDHDYRLDGMVADLTLPTKSGVQVALILRTKIPDLPVILASGYPVSGWTETDRAGLLQLGASSVGILQKPFRGQELLDLLGDLIDSPQAGKMSVA